MTESSLRGTPTRPSLLSSSELDLADAARRVLLGAREEHVLPGLRAQLAGRLRGHRPLQRVGDVGLARAVRPDDDGDAAVEAQLERLAERLEAAQADRAQVHSRPSLSTRSSASWAAACSEAFLDGPSPRADDLVAEHGGGGEAAAVRWSGCLHQPVAYGRPLTCQAFLQFRLVIDEALLAVFDALVEGLDDRIGGLAGSRGAGRRRRSRTRTARPARCGSARCGSRRRAAARSRSNSAARSSVRATSAQERARDDVGALLREAALVDVGSAAIELLGDREPEHAVAEELQSLV